MHYTYGTSKKLVKSNLKVHVNIFCKSIIDI